MLAFLNEVCLKDLLSNILGPMGPKGDRGLPGNTGMKGEAGPMGPQGKNMEPFHVRVWCIEIVYSRGHTL